MLSYAFCSRRSLPREPFAPLKMTEVSLKPRGKHAERRAHFTALHFATFTRPRSRLIYFLSLSLSLSLVFCPPVRVLIQMELFMSLLSLSRSLSRSHPPLCSSWNSKIHSLKVKLKKKGKSTV
jgi:hypothetical protein